METFISVFASLLTIVSFFLGLYTYKNDQVKQSNPFLEMIPYSPLWLKSFIASEMTPGKRLFLIAINALVSGSIIGLFDKLGIQGSTFLYILLVLLLFMMSFWTAFNAQSGWVAFGRASVSSGFVALVAMLWTPEASGIPDAVFGIAILGGLVGMGSYGIKKLFSD
jgi:hypothetical protein